MRYLSVCSGIEAASVAWKPLGWTPEFFSEIEQFPSAVLQHHYPEVPNLGDMNNFSEWPDADVDVLVGGTPCQSFSLAGLRKGLDDPRGNLMLTFLAIARRYRPRWVVWENVPGVLSSKRGGDFGTFLGALGECGYGWSYRVLDAQYVRTSGFPRAVPQRRRRVFVVGYLGDWRRAAAVLFEREGLQGHPAPRREAGQGVATRAASGVAIRGREGGGTAELTGDVATALRASQGGGDKPYVLAAIQERAVSENPDAGPGGAGYRQDGTSYTLEARTVPQAVAFGAQNSAAQGDDVCYNHSPPLSCTRTPAVAFSCKDYGADAGGQVATASAYLVRRLTPEEAEALQGFPRNWTRIPYRNKPAENCPDGPRYKALGNAMAVPVIRFIGQRISAVEDISNAD